MKTRSLFALALFYFLSSNVYSGEPVNLLFCYEDKELPPYYMGVGSETPKEMPGATIDIIQSLALSIDNLNISFIRQPWKRCLSDLGKSKVDAVVGNYRSERKKIGRFPLVNNMIDRRRSVSSQATCFVSEIEADFGWDGKRLKSNMQPTIAVPAGYSIISKIKTLPVVIHEALSVEQALHLLVEKRVDMAVSLCQIDEKDRLLKLTDHQTLKMIYPPIKIQRGYLILSHGFYNRQPELAEKIWHYFIDFKSDTFFQKYII